VASEEKLPLDKLRVFDKRGLWLRRRIHHPSRPERRDFVPDPKKPRTGGEVRPPKSRSRRPANAGESPSSRHYPAAESLSLLDPRGSPSSLGRSGKIDPRARVDNLVGMKGEFTAIIEAAPEGGYWAICPEVPGANGQGETIEEAKQSLGEAIRLILEDRLEDAQRGLPDDAIQTSIAV
jgi:predicted RNase H-like HicB family nuclease